MTPILQNITLYDSSDSFQEHIRMPQLRLSQKLSFYFIKDMNLVNESKIGMFRT